MEGIDANILVVCGRNETLQQELKDRDWDLVIHQYHDDHLIQTLILNLRIYLTDCLLCQLR